MTGLGRWVRADMETAVSAALGATAAWHGLAAYYFVLHPAGILRRFMAGPPLPAATRLRMPLPGGAASARVAVPGAAPAHMPHLVLLLRFLGALNLSIVGIAVLTLLRRFRYQCTGTSVQDALFLLGLANGSQFVVDVLAHWEGKVNALFLAQITLPDGAFCALNLWLWWHAHRVYRRVSRDVDARAGQLARDRSTSNEQR